MAMTTSQKVTAQRFSEADWDDTDWKCFPAPYVMPEQQRNRSRNQKASNFSHTLRDAQWQSSVHDDLPRAQAVRPSRSRARLQKRPSQRLLDHPPNPTDMMPQPTSHMRGPSSGSQDLTALPQLSDQAIPERRSSLRTKPATEGRPQSRKEKLAEPMTTTPLAIRSKPSPKDVDNENTNRNSDSDRSASSNSNHSSSNASRTPRHQPLAPNDPSPLNPLYHIPTSSFTYGSHNELAQSTGDKNEHVLLPAGFKPGKTEYTYVDEIVRPAVTHEVIKHEKTEIIQEEITKEIHVHHYYTYTQPIKAVEVLPARHFIIDSETGAKLEIVPPEGWSMPSHLQPHKPDISGIGTETRHYLVNQQHPRGVLEPAPPQPKARSPQLDQNKKGGTTGHWTPFPKTR